MKRNRQVKFGTFKCQCGCGEDFTANYITRTPRYLDKSHRNKVLAKNKAKAREEKHKELFRLYKARRASLRKLKIAPWLADQLAEAIDADEFLSIAAKAQAAHLEANSD